MKKNKNAFTMIELVFVIVILGILAAVAVPRFAATRTDAQISKARADIASIRSAIVTERQSRLIKGDPKFINKLHNNNTLLFDGNGTSKLLMYGIKTENTDGHWQATPVQTDATADKEVWEYKFKILGADNKIIYKQEDGTFKCTQGADALSCDKLTN